MSLIPTVGRKSWSARIFITVLYVILTIGAVTMVYPFLIMLSTSVKSGADVNNYGVIPQYLRDDSILFAKYAEIKYSADLDAINSYYGMEFAKIENITPPQTSSLSDGQRALANDWTEFAGTLSMDYKQSNFGPIGFAPSSLLEMYRKHLRVKFDDNIAALNKKYVEENSSFEQVYTPFERPTKREWQPDNSPKMQEWLQFESTLPGDYLRTVGIDPLFAAFLKVDKYEGDIEKLNAAYGTKYKSFTEVHLSPALTGNPVQQVDWIEFVRTQLPFRYMKLSPDALPAYRAYLQNRYTGSISQLNGMYETKYRSFNDINLPKVAPISGPELIDWMDFIARDVPISTIRPVNTENLFREYAITKYGDLASVNKAYDTKISSIEELSPPYHLSDWSYVLSHKKDLREHFLTRNYGMVMSYILLHGRAVLNTVIFCLLVIITHLIVNPLCAYALSRYNLKYAYKILLFLLATMAFPTEVAMIPNFLLLKNLNMLNTYWALVLPGMASGFSIFLLKGFFDSLPKELYEAGIIDGASEMHMFRKITIPLSKPIFAVIALQSFTAAYGAFMFAFLVCQNPKMWTMMVWLYELQITAPKYITMAALTVAALPTLLVFIFAQNIIMRGIILPSYK
ncbi:MAG: carbohydrate ABC transporter permease [Armatimonadota bacterium]